MIKRKTWLLSTGRLTLKKTEAFVALCGFLCLAQYFTEQDEFCV